MTDVKYTKHTDYKLVLSQVEQGNLRGFPHFPEETHSVSHKCLAIILNFISSHQELSSTNIHKFWQHNTKWKEQ